MIVVKKSETADTRTCDWSKVTKEQLLKSSMSHIADVFKGMMFFAKKLTEAAAIHDYTKIDDIDGFFRDFQTGFATTKWWEEHQDYERHHFNDEKYIQDDINLVDVIEQIVDGVMAGMARSGQYRIEEPLPELLIKAYRNTAKLLLDNIQLDEDGKGK